MNNSSPGFKKSQEELSMRRSGDHSLYGKLIENVTQITSHLVPMESNLSSLPGDGIQIRPKTPSNHKQSANKQKRHQFFFNSDDDEFSDHFIAPSNQTNDPTKVHCTCKQCLASSVAMSLPKTPKNPNSQQCNKSRIEKENVEEKSNKINSELLHNENEFQVCSSSACLENRIPLDKQSSLDSFDDFFQETPFNSKCCSCSHASNIAPILTRDARKHNYDFTYHVRDWFNQ